MAALTSKNARLSHQLATFGIGRDFTVLWLLDEDFSFETSMTSVSSPNDFWISKPFAMTGVLAWQVIRCSMKFDWCVQGGDRMGLNSRVLSQGMKPCIIRCHKQRFLTWLLGSCMV